MFVSTLLFGAVLLESVICGHFIPLANLSIFPLIINVTPIQVFITAETVI